MLFLNGLIIGMIAGFPAGPLGAICMGEMIRGRVRQGFIRGMGAVTANFLYSAILVFGLGIISDFLLQNIYAIRLGGSVLILFLGLGIFFSRQREQAARQPEVLTLGSTYLAGFLVAVSNPTKITAFTGLLTFFGLSSLHGAGLLQLWSIVGGVVAGSLAWWIILSAVARRILARIKNSSSEFPQKLLNRIFGSIIMILGLVIFVLTLLERSSLA